MANRNLTLALQGEDKPTIQGIVKTGQKNLLINGRKLIQQRGTTGGKVQVVLNTANLGGEHTISFTGTATVTIKEASTLGASDALTSWDTPLATNVASGTTITLTAGKYVHVEFSTTVFDFAQLELGDGATNFEARHDELDLCLPYFEIVSVVVCANWADSTNQAQLAWSVNKRTTPLMLLFGSSVGGSVANIGLTSFRADGNGTGFGGASVSGNAEIFNADDGVGINYKEDRWYV